MPCRTKTGVAESVAVTCFARILASIEPKMSVEDGNLSLSFLKKGWPLSEHEVAAMVKNEFSKMLASQSS